MTSSCHPSLIGMKSRVGVSREGVNSRSLSLSPEPDDIDRGEILKGSMKRRNHGEESVAALCRTSAEDVVI